jgi:membrane-bound metal-dependent hydrolase YbcI (DUF457 family)
MPVTPFHFGPGLLAKAIAPRHVSLTAFVGANVVIDLESGYFLLTGEWPVHRTLHTFAAATLAGLLVGFLVHRFRSRLPVRGNPSSAHLYSALLGGGLGGSSHALLDGIMHADMHPFRPFTEANPLLLAIGVGTLHLFCVATGAVGLLWLTVRGPRA